MPALAKLSDFRDLMGWTATDNDALAEQLLARASATAARLARRKSLLRQAGVVEFPHPGVEYVRVVRVAYFPIESVTSVKQLYWSGTDAEFTTAEALVENEDYVVRAELGELERIIGDWCTRPRALRIEYTGGYADPSSDPMPADAILPPDDLQHGVLMEAQRLWHQRNMAGIDRVDLGQGGAVQAKPNEPHPDLVAATAALQFP